jgi:Tol biopolymer transport system component/serine/threonine protein kinase
MHPERWKQIKEIVDVGLGLAPGERSAYLARVCEGDAELLDEVGSLIAAYEESGDTFEERPASARPDRMIGARFGPYKLVEVIGTGGMGSVYRARRADEEFEKEVAVKVLRRGLDLDYVVRHFRLERQIMASLDHPNIARLLDGGTTEDGLPYFVMEYIRGKPVTTYCRERRLGTRERLALFRTVCEAVEFAHKQGVVHRDIKPGNILVTANGTPKLLDFGIAKILNPEQMPHAGEPIITVTPALTPEYASPEQMIGAPVTEASDVYSLGVLLCELLTGRRPGESPPNAGVPREVDDIVRMAVQVNPAHRYATAGPLGADVGNYLNGLPVRARQGHAAYRASKFLRRKSSLVLAVGVGLCVPLAYYLVDDLRGVVVRQPPMQIVPITSAAGREFQPSFSPDGKKIAYSASGEAGENTHIYVQAIGLGDPVRLTRDAAADLSSVWSPDGKRIAWLRTGPGETAIFVSPASGGAQDKVADLYPNRIETVGRQLDWSPDGGWFAAADKEAEGAPFRIVLVGARDGRKRQVTQPPEGVIGDMAPCFSPDGNSVAFIRGLSSGVNDLYVVPLAGGESRRVTRDNRYILSAAWGPGGKTLVFSSDRARNRALWSVPVSGGTATRVPMVSENASDPAFSRDGENMAYSQLFEDTNIWRFDLGGRAALRKVVASTQLDTSPSISPDGTRIAFRSNRSGSNEIWESDSEGRAARQVTHVGGPLTGSPKWSPDGSRLAFDSRPEGQADIFTMQIGGSMQRITRSPSEDVVPNWSRDGKWIYFASNRSGAWQVWRTPSDGKGPEIQVTNLGGFAAAESADGRYLYYAKGRTTEGLWRKRLPDGEEEAFISNLRAGLWGYWTLAPNGVYFLDWSGPSAPAPVWWQPFEGARKQAGTLGPLVIGGSGFTLSPDGRYLLYSQIDQAGSDILLLEHYRR